MSDYERNKGKLIPTTLDEIKQECPKIAGEEEEEEDSYLDRIFYSDQYVEIQDTLYRIEWEVYGENCYDFADVKKNEDGTINFHTLHYNGGGHWTEVVEDALA